MLYALICEPYIEREARPDTRQNEDFDTAIKLLRFRTASISTRPLPSFLRVVRSYADKFNRPDLLDALRPPDEVLEEEIQHAIKQYETIKKNWHLAALLQPHAKSDEQNIPIPSEAVQSESRESHPAEAQAANS